MKRFSEQLHKKSLSVKLQAKEKRELRDRVVSYMEYHPMPGSAPAKKSVASPYFTESFVSIPFSYFGRLAVGTAVFMMVIVPALAEQAVPGDSLYAVKVRFNEEVRSTLALSTYEKIEWETERLNRRIAEARLLADEGRLTEEVETEVAAAVKTHTENAKREIEVLRSEDAEEADLATIELSTTLEVQAASLKEKKNRNNSDDTSADEELGGILATAVEAAAEESVAKPVAPGYNKLMARVEVNTTRVYEILGSLNLDESTDEYKDITRRLQDIERTVDDAIVQKGMDEETARLLLVDALQRTQKLIVFMSEIQTNKDFEVEDFVPVVLTPEEEQVEKTEVEKVIRVQISDIELRRASSSDQSVIQKTDVALTRLTEIQAQVASSTAGVEIGDLFEEFESLAKDTLKLLPETNQTTIISVPDTEPKPERPTSSEEAIQSETAE